MPTINIPRESTMQEIRDALQIIAIAQTMQAADINSWSAVQQIIRNGFGRKTFPVGTQFSCSHEEYGEIIWDVVAHDHHPDPSGRNEHSMTLLMHYAINGIPVDAAEALYVAADGLAAGTYNFTLPTGISYESGCGAAGGESYQFTLTKDVPTGAQICLSWNWAQDILTKAKINVYADGSAANALESVTVETGNDGTSLGIADGSGAHMNHIQRARFGSNNYRQSAIRQYINTSGISGSWWQKQTEFDRIPNYASKAGFLAGFSTDFLNVIGETEHIVKTNNIFEIDDTTKSSYAVKDQFFLLSLEEVGFNVENNIQEGTALEYFENAAGVDRMKYDHGNKATARNWWLRSPHPGYAHYVRDVNVSGALNHNTANSGNALAPACTIY